MHPVVQVYTIPRTRQLAYVGHVCNFRRKVTELLSRLLTLPGNMPFVQVRPGSSGGQPSRKAPFTVNVQKLRHAFEWLRVNNPYYHDVEWREGWAQEWRKDDVDIGTRRDEDFEDCEAIAVNKEAFEMWMQWVLHHRASGDDGFKMGGALAMLWRVFFVEHKARCLDMF